MLPPGGAEVLLVKSSVKEGRSKYVSTLLFFEKFAKKIAIGVF